MLIDKWHKRIGDSTHRGSKWLGAIIGLVLGACIALLMTVLGIPAFVISDLAGAVVAAVLYRKLDRIEKLLKTVKTGMEHSAEGERQF